MTRKEALALGLNTFEGNPCKVCGSTEKYTSSYGCKKCTLDKLNNKELMARYRTKEKTNERVKRWRANNPDKLKAQRLRSYERHGAANSAKYRAAKRNAVTEDSDFEIIKKIYEKCKRVSEETGIPHDVDHIVPISKGGLHHQDNLRIITSSENRSKGNRLEH